LCYFFLFAIHFLARFIGLSPAIVFAVLVSLPFNCTAGQSAVKFEFSVFRKKVSAAKDPNIALKWRQLLSARTKFDHIVIW